MKRKNDKFVLILSLATALYFAAMIATYYLKIDNQVLRFVGELVTIPAIILLLVLSVWSGIALSKEKKKFFSLSFYSLLLLFATIVLLVLNT